MSQPLCSVLLPSLCRFDKLLAAVQSFYDTADDFEMIVRLHLSDEVAVSRVDELLEMGDNLRVVWGGEVRSNDFLWNELRPLATGLWHQYWSDDMIISGPWGTELAKHNPRHEVVVQPAVHQLNQSTYHRDSGGPTPFVPADAFERCGLDSMPDVPDAAVNRVLIREHGWRVEFLEGVTVDHRRVSDSTLPRL